MDSDDDGFAKQGGEPIDIGADFDDSEEEPEEPEDEEEEEPQSDKPQAMQHMSGPKPAQTNNTGAGEVKGQKVDNQPFDLAVDVNDSEEIESDEEEERMNADMEVEQ